MVKNLVIVESPAKAKTIEKFLGSDFTVKSCYGHVRDLSKKDNGVDIKGGFRPFYTVSSDKKKVVDELKKLSDGAEVVWLATDEDREGEAIAWHLKEVLKLKNDKIRRIVFHEITKDAILNAVSNPRTIDDNLVNAQQSRRILDRLVGFEISPVLWKKVRPSLSAGRVQSVAVRLIVEREREIENFNTTYSYRVTGTFALAEAKGKKSSLDAELNKRFDTYDEALAFINACRGASFSVGDLERKEVRRTPAPPFTTSTLQQEAARKLRFSVSRTMVVAQRLYESGYITYMRTDSVNLSQLALNTAKKEIENTFGPEYHQFRKFRTRTANAQEAHEAIRPAYIDRIKIDGTRDDQMLYDLIRKRTLASQMADAVLEKNIAKIDISTSSYQFVAEGESILFDGFLKLYIESRDEDENEDSSEKILPPLKTGEKLFNREITATQRFARPNARYTEASLVKKLEELGIGRPSTYAPVISNIQNRGYVVKDERPGKEREYQVIRLDSAGNVTQGKATENYGAEKAKLFPTDIGILVNDFLVNEFSQIVDFKFTAKIEQQLDDVSNGALDGTEMLETFYKPFHQNIEETLENSGKITGERFLGINPETGEHVSARMARFGPVIQLTKPDDPDYKPRFAGLKKDQRIDMISLEDALSLFKLPRSVGEYEGNDITVAIGKFGPYVRHDGKFVSIPKADDPYAISLKRCIELIEEKREKDGNKFIKLFPEDPDLKILNGRWGPYIAYKGSNFRIPKNTDAAGMEYEEVMRICQAEGKTQGTAKKGRGR